MDIKYPAVYRNASIAKSGLYISRFQYIHTLFLYIQLYQPFILLFFIVDSIRIGNMIALMASLLFLLGCVQFIVPLVHSIHDANKTIGDIRSKHNSGELSIHGNQKVSTLEQVFHDHYGLNVQVFRTGQVECRQR